MGSGTSVVKTLKNGTYTIVVADKSSIHNFHLFGPGVNKKTTVLFTGKQTWTVTLKPGKYTYQCDVHAATGMKGTFKVTS
jgi:plastocyanin